MAHFQQPNQSYVINWDSISCENQNHFAMSDPFQDYEKPIQKFLQRISIDLNQWTRGKRKQAGYRVGSRGWLLLGALAGRTCPGAGA